MVAYKGVGDRADHPYCAGAEAVVERVFEKNDIGLAVEPGLVVHTMVGNEPDDGTELDQALHPVVDRAVKGVPLRVSRRMRMLNEIGERQIQELGRLAFE